MSKTSLLAFIAVILVGLCFGLYKALTNPNKKFAAFSKKSQQVRIWSCVAIIVVAAGSLIYLLLT